MGTSESTEGFHSFVPIRLSQFGCGFAALRSLGVLSWFLPSLKLPPAWRALRWRIFMHWVAPSEKDGTNGILERRLWEAADQFRAKIQNLRRTGDLLLPRLLSGQVKLGTEAA